MDALVEPLATLQPLAVNLSEPAENPLWLLLAAFGVGAVIVWLAGTKLSRWADRIARRTEMGQALVGVLLLGAATGLPEMATSVSVAALGNGAMAGAGLLGAIAMQLAVLAAIDVVAVRRGALTFFTPKPALLMQGVMLVMMLCLVIAAMAAGEVLVVLGVGAWSAGLLLTYVAALWTIQRYEGDPRWHPLQPGGESEPGEPPVADGPPESVESATEVPMRRVWLYFALAALGVLIGGFLVARAGDAIAERTGLGASLLGATLLALATSLPEISTTWGAVRIGAYVMAVANILGTNAFSVALIFVADISYREGGLLSTLDNGAIFVAALGAVLTCVYLWGLLERRDRSLLRGGYDSIAVLVLYAAGMAIFYFIS